MKPQSMRYNLPKINKSIVCKEKNIKDSFSKRKSTLADINIENHRLFRKRIVRLKEQKMKGIIKRNQNKFFDKENSMSSLSPFKSTTKDEKNSTSIIFEGPHIFRRNESDIFLKSKEPSFNKGFNISFIKKTKLKAQKEYVNTYRDLKLNFSKYFYIKTDEVFIKYVIDRFVTNKIQLHKLNTKNINHNVRRIYVIMQNSIVTNINDIPGIFINIPNFSLLKTYQLEKREKLYQNLLKILNKRFECKRKINSIFSPNKDIILDLLDIKREYKYIYVSPTIICKSISIVISPNFINLYNNDFQDFLYGIKKHDYNILTKFITKKRKTKFKIDNITKGIKSKYEQLKPHYSFSAGENEIENIEYIYYSDNEEKKEKLEKDNHLNKDYILKNDFFINLVENDINKKLKPLEDNLNYKTTFNLKESYDNFTIDFRKLLSRFRQELYKKYGLNPKNFNSESAKNKNVNYDFRDMDNKFEKLFLQKNFEKIKLNKKFNKKKITNIDKKVNRQYSHFVTYNIPKIVPNPELRKKFFDIFVQFKSLVSIALSMKQNDFILKNGLDFDTFWNCIPEIQDEREFFAKKLFTHMNKSNSSLLNIKDFINGMNFIKNSHLSEKLELYMHSMNIGNNGQINYSDAVKISKQSILKNLDGDNNVEDDGILVKELSTFLASYIFKLVGCDTKSSINIDDLKRIINKSKESNDIEVIKDLEYLELFCGI